MILVGADLDERDLVPLADLQTRLLEFLVDLRREDDPPVLGRADEVVQQDRDVMALVDELAHPHTLTQQAAGNVPAEIQKGA